MEGRKPLGCAGRAGVRPERKVIASFAKSSYGIAIDMYTVTVSPKYQVVIPQAVREGLHLTPGEKMRVLRYQGRVELIPVRPMQELRGFLAGIDTQIDRDEDRL